MSAKKRPHQEMETAYNAITPSLNDSEDPVLKTDEDDAFHLGLWAVASSDWDPTLHDQYTQLGYQDPDYGDETGGFEGLGRYASLHAHLPGYDMLDTSMTPAHTPGTEGEDHDHFRSENENPLSPAITPGSAQFQEQHQHQKPKRQRRKKGDPEPDYSAQIRSQLEKVSRTCHACDRCKVKRMKCDSESLGCMNCRLSDHPCKVTNSVDHTYIRGEAQILQNQISLLQVRVRELEFENAKLMVEVRGGSEDLDGSEGDEHGSPQQGQRESESSVSEDEDQNQGGCETAGESYLGLQISPVTTADYDEGCGFRDVSVDVDVEYDDFDEDETAADLNGDCVGSFLGFAHHALQ